MKILLDTHTLIWWLTDDESLSRPARDAIEGLDNEIFVSAASAMEIATKHRLGKLPEAAVLAHDFEAITSAEGFLPLPISVHHAIVAGSLRIAHKDPFDRFLIAQSLVDAMPFVSNERVFDALGVARIW